MTKNEVEAFLRTSFFHALVPQESQKNEGYKDYVASVFKRAFEQDFQNYSRFFQDVLENYAQKVKIDFYEIKNENYLAIVKQSVLEFLIQEDTLKYFCLEEDYDKLVKVIGFKQFNSKLIAATLGRISYVADEIIQYSENDLENITLVLYSDIKRKIIDFNNNFVIKTMGKFKEKIDKITSGVNIKCYLDFKNMNYFNSFPQELNDYMLEKHGYVYSQNSHYIYETKDLAELLSLALDKDESIWVLEGMSKKTIFDFLNLVYKYNDLKHAAKILDYAFEEACKNEKIKYLYDSKQPFYLYNVETEMVNWCLNRLAANVKTAEFDVDEKTAAGLITPIIPGYDNEIELGKGILDKFLKKAYFEEYDKVKLLFLDTNNIIQDGGKIDDNHFKNQLTIRDMIEYDLIGFNNVKEKENFLSSYYKDYFTNESILNRFYYRLFLISKCTSDDLLFQSLYEYLYSMLRMMDIKYNLKSSFVYDTKLREEKYSLLKNILAKYGYKIDDKYKQEYIIALLDRKYATIEETSKFPELEQYGDAIYDLAVDNIIFYDPEYKMSLNHQEREKYVKADAQVKVSKNIGLDKTYISSLTDSINNKLSYEESVEFRLSPIREGHFLADSLEMILAVMAKQFGLEETLKFAAKIIVEANPELTMPVIYENFDYIKMFNDQSYDRDYLNKIYPGPFSDDEYHHEYNTLSYSISKVLRIRIIGNETKEKRQIIADTFSIQNKKTNQIYDSYQFVYWYLHYGIEETIKKFKDVVESSYIEE